RELRERDHGDGGTRTAAIAGVRCFRRAGGRRQAQVHAVARGQHRERAIIARDGRALRYIADADRSEQAQRGERGSVWSESDPQLLEAGPDARLRRAERQAELGGDLRVGEVVGEGETERLALRRRKLRERR